MPDGTVETPLRSLGSASKPWKDLHISDATMYVGGEVQTGWKADTVTRETVPYTDIKFEKKLNLL